MMMDGPPSSLFSRACRIFLTLAYPEGKVPDSRRPFLHLAEDAELEPLLQPPICERLASRDYLERRGYAFRLGSTVFPHLKLQVLWHPETGQWLFAVDTHDAIFLPSNYPDQEQLRRLNELKTKNRQLKERIERAWEEDGLLTFSAILRRALTP
jgi:hypothetical protein